MLRQLKSVFKDSVIYGLGSLLPRAAGFLLVPVYTRFMGPDQYGILSMSGIVASAMGSIYMLGLNGSVTRFFRGANSEDEERDLRSMLFTAVIASVVLGGILLALTLLFGQRLFLGLVRDDGFTFEPYITVAVWGAFLAGPTIIWQAVARAQRKSMRFVRVQLGSFAVNTAVSLALVVGLQMGALGSLLGTAIASALFVPLSLWFLQRDMTYQWSWRWLGKLLVFGLPLVPHYFAGWTLSFADRYILERFTSLSSVGIYSLAYNVAMATSFVAMAVNQAWTPIYYDMVESDDAATLPRTTTIYAATVGLFCAYYLLGSRQLLVLVADAQFHAAAPVVPIVIAGYFMQAMYFVTSTPLFYAKRTGLIPLISAGAGIVNILLNLALIPGWGPFPALGIYGAAWATFAAFTVMALASWALSSAVKARSFENSRMVRIALIFGFAWMADAVIARFVPAVFDWRSLLARLVAGGIVLGLFVVMDVVTPREIRAFVTALNKRRTRVTAQAEKTVGMQELTADGQTPDEMDA